MCDSELFREVKFGVVGVHDGTLHGVHDCVLDPRRRQSGHDTLDDQQVVIPQRDENFREYVFPCLFPVDVCHFDFPPSLRLP